MVLYITINILYNLQIASGVETMRKYYFFLFFYVYRAGGVCQIVEHLPGKHKALSSNPSTAKKKKKRFLLLHM
jgi:hypothetical protein